MAGGATRPVILMRVDAAEVVRRWWDEVWSQGNLDAVDELIAEPYVRHGRAGTVRRTRNDVKADLQQYFRVMHRPVITIHEQAFVGDRVWTRLTMEGVNLETSERRVLSWLYLQRLDATGRIAESWQLSTDGVGWE